MSIVRVCYMALMTHVKRQTLAQLSAELMDTWLVDYDAAKTVADNLRRIIAASGLSSRGWSLKHKLEPKMVQRITSASHSSTLATLNAVADAAGLMTWQLLIPNLDPRNPPTVTITEAERNLYRALRQHFEKLPDLNGE